MLNIDKDKDNQIFQSCIYQHKILVSTIKTYYTINTLIDKLNQVGSREKKILDGKLGSCYYQDDQKSNII